MPVPKSLENEFSLLITIYRFRHFWKSISQISKEMWTSDCLVKFENPWIPWIHREPLITESCNNSVEWDLSCKWAVFPSRNPMCECIMNVENGVFRSRMNYVRLLVKTLTIPTNLLGWMRLFPIDWVRSNSDRNG